MTDTPTCRHLAGRCTRTGQHWDHASTPIAIPAPRGLAYPELMAAWLAEYDDNREPLLVVAAGNDAVELNTAEALDLADQLQGMATQLRRLACYQSVAINQGARRTL